MSAISSTFNGLANYQSILLLAWFWISAAIDAQNKEDKEREETISRNMEEQKKPTVTHLPSCGFP